MEFWISVGRQTRPVKLIKGRKRLLKGLYKWSTQQINNSAIQQLLMSKQAKNQLLTFDFQLITIN